MILYLAADLLWASKIKGTADALGIPCRPVRTPEMLEARLAEAASQTTAGTGETSASPRDSSIGSENPGGANSPGARAASARATGTGSAGASAPSVSPLRAILLDLDKAEEALAMIARVRGEDRWRGVRMVCFGPHVLKELFQRARDAGADEVMPRGSLDARLDEVLLRLETGGRV